MTSSLEDKALEEPVLTCRSREGVPGEGRGSAGGSSSGQMLTGPGATCSMIRGVRASAFAGLSLGGARHPRSNSWEIRSLFHSAEIEHPSADYRLDAGDTG